MNSALNVALTHADLHLDESIPVVNKEDDTQQKLRFLRELHGRSWSKKTVPQQFYPLLEDSGIPPAKRYYWWRAQARHHAITWMLSLTVMCQGSRCMSTSCIQLTAFQRRKRWCWWHAQARPRVIAWFSNRTHVTACRFICPTHRVFVKRAFRLVALPGRNIL